MPELPDVEGFRRYLAEHAEGRRIVGVDVLDSEIVRNRTPRTLRRALKGERFAAPGRHGKWLLAPVGDVTLLLHFGMTGALQWARTNDGRDRHDRVVFVCTGGELRYNNMRRFGGIWLARGEHERERVTGPLGPDAASIDRARLHELLARRRGQIKAALMDQRLLAGLGNLLSDEILWRARIHPATPVSKLSRARRDRLYDALHGVVVQSSRYGRVPRASGWLTGVRDDPQGSCPRCGTRLRHSTIAGRTSCWCPRCQRR